MGSSNVAHCFVQRDSEVDEVLNALDMEAYLDREGIEYKHAHGSRGPQLNLQECPFCGSDKWKVFVNAESGLGNCFSGDCEKKFNKFSFIRAYTQLGGRDLREHILSVGKEIGWRPVRKAQVAVNVNSTELAIPPSYPLPIRGQNLKYLENRGIDIETAKYFHLRFCRKGFFKYQVNGEERFMPFHNRVIIPVFDLDGELVSFQGRDITGKAEKKYLFPPGFSVTGAHLYNGHNIHNTKRILVGEGAFDVAAQKLALDEDPALRDVVPVGTFGKHLSVDQLSRFLELKEKRGVEEVTIMWDGEVSAIDDAIDAAIKLRGIGLRTRVAILPKDKDPNEVSAEVVRAAFYGAVEINPVSAAALKIKIRR